MPRSHSRTRGDALRGVRLARSFARHMLAPPPSMSVTPRSTCVATTTNNAQRDCTCCDTVDSRLSGFPDPTSRRTLRCDEETCASLLSSLGRCPGRQLIDESRDTAIARSSTTPSCSRPRNHCTRANQRSVSTSPFVASTRRTGPVCASPAGHDRAP